MLGSWVPWALLAAFFAALTAIFAKIGVEGINSDLATLVRTIVILLIAGAFVSLGGQWQSPGSIGARTWVFLILSGAATGLSWLCYFRALQLGNASQVAPVDKLSVVMVAVVAAVFLGERLTTINWLGVLMITGGAVLVAYR